MIPPEKVSTDYYANKAKQEHIAGASLVGMSALAAFGFGIEYIDKLEGKGLLGGAIVLGAIACRSLNKAFKYSFREGQVHGK